MKTSNVITSLALAALLLSACGISTANQPEEKIEVKLGEVGEFPIVEEPLQMTMMGPGVGMADWHEMPVFQTMAEKSNIEFSFTTPPISSFATKLNLAFATGDLPDVLFGTDPTLLTPTMEMSYGDQGLLVPLEDLIEDNMPNFSRLLKENPEIAKSITTAEGHIYSLPMISRGTTAIWPSDPLWYNGEWLEQLNVTELPQTTDEFFDLLLRFRDETPNQKGKKETIPLSDIKMASLRAWLLPAFGLTNRTIEEIDGTVVYAPATENYKAFLVYMNKLYEEKLIDPKIYSQSNEQLKSKVEKNQVGLFPAWYSYFITGKSENEAIKDPMFYPLTSDIQKERIAPASPQITRTAFAITKKNPSPEATLRWVDYFYSAEGADFLNNGPEGAFWQYEENQKGEQVRVYTDVVNFKNKEQYRATVTPHYGIAVPMIDDPEWSKEYPVILEEANTEKDTTFNDFIAKEIAEKITPFAKVTFPLLYLTNEEMEKSRTIESDMRLYVEQMEAKFITGAESLENWDSYLQTLEEIGVEEYVSIYQGAYDRWASNAD